MNHGQRVGNHFREGTAHRRGTVYRCVVNGRKLDIGFVLETVVSLGGINLEHHIIAGLGGSCIHKQCAGLVIQLEAVDGVAAHHRNHHLALVASIRTGNWVVGIQHDIVTDGECTDILFIILFPPIMISVMSLYHAVKVKSYLLAYQVCGVVPLKFCVRDLIERLSLFYGVAFRHVSQRPVAALEHQRTAVLSVIR